MKHRFLYLISILVLFLSVGTSLIHPGTASAAPEYFYTNKSFDGIQGPNPYATADQPTTITYGKTTSLGKGIYIDKNAAITDNSTGGFCYPAIQTNSKKYDGDKNAKLYLQCGGFDHINLKNSKGSVSISSSDQNTFQEQQARSQCQDKSGEAHKACTAGYVGGANGKTQAEACQGFTGNNLSICQNAYTAGADTSTGSDSPNCEDDGGKLSWILCPIFDELSNASQWIFGNIVEPFLITPPISTNPEDPSFQIWSTLRIYGNIFLIIALLVIVFGESIGGGVIDAYTAKKVLPRLLVAAVLINLSIYIVAFLVDFTNILGQGIGNILTEPLTHCSNGAGGNCWDFQLTTGDQARVFGIGLVGLLAGGTAIAGFLGTIIFSAAGGITAVITMAFFVMLPVFLAVLAVFITLIIRKGLILMLVLVSPVAFALYCLPNTERYFRRWWELLMQALMVYPIIVAIFGVAEILSVTILTSNGISPSDLQGSGASDFFAGNLNRTLSLMVAFLLQFLPLLAVPFAFRFAGSAMGRIYEAATGAGQRVNQLAENRREHAKRDYQAQALSARGRIYHGARDFGDKNRRIPGVRAASRWVGNRAGGYNIEALLSAGRAEKIKQLEDQIATGRDEEIRGLTVNKAAALGSNGKQAINRNGKWVDSRSGAELSTAQLDTYDVRTGENGAREFRSLGGAWINEQQVDAGYSRWGHDEFAQQAALGYEMRKGITDEQRDRIKSKYYDLATSKGGWNMSSGMAAGTWKGAGFANQNTNLEYKHLNFDQNGTQQFNRDAFVSEVYEKRGSYDMSRMDAGTIGRLQEAWDAAPPNSQQRVELQSIARTMQDRLAARSDREVVPGAEGGEATQQASAIGSGHVTEAMNRFVSTALGGGDQ